uniref:RNase_Zc3h12a domain-containing protein n=1 Tax=Anopheles maculatus TaxID=74869 RepID=A0A182T0F1_9DIPT
MVSKRKEGPNHSKSPKPQINRKRPEKLASAKQRHGENSKHPGVKKSIQKRTHKPPSRSLDTANRYGNRIVLLDGCNLSHTSNRLPRFKTERLAKALQYFVDRGHPVYTVFPRFHLYTRQWDDVGRLDGLYRKNYIVPTPCKEYPNPKSQVYDDRILMAIAAKFDCAVISNDRFRDVASEHPEWARVAHNQTITFDWDRNENLQLPSYSSDILNA